MTRRRSRQADLKAIYRLHGGEMMFWLKWVDGRIDPAIRHELLAWSCEDGLLHSTIESLQGPDVRTQLRYALEATNYLTPGSPTQKDEDDSTSMILGQQPPSVPRDHLVGNAEELTYGVIAQSSPRRAPATASRGASDRSGVYARVKLALGRLLAEVDIVSPMLKESFEAKRLLHHLVGDESVNHFRTLHNWLRAARRRAASNAKSLSMLDRLLAWAAPECFASTPRSELSFRLFLRSRLKAYCRAQGWRPTGQKYATLELAFRDLDRSRIGELIRDAMREANADPTSELARAIAPPAEALLAQAA
jgi:hypothetical protein